MTESLVYTSIRLASRIILSAITSDVVLLRIVLFFFSSRRRHTRCGRDWSSDVCSSDLAEVPQVRAAALVTRGSNLRHFGRLDGAVSDLERASSLYRQYGSPRLARAQGNLEIGRASCRERGEISVVAGSFKKKKRKNGRR